MNKIKYLLTLLSCFFIMSSVSAATINSTDYTNGKINISGEGTGNIQIAIFDSNKQPIYFTTATSSDGKFSITLPKIEGLAEGEYLVKAANYDGTSAVSKIVEVKEVKIDNPNTSDNILVYVIVSCVSIFGLGAIVLILKDKLKHKKIV